MQCSICLDVINKNEINDYTCSNNHLFHYNCIKKWAFHNESCPYCREYIECQSNNNNRKILLRHYKLSTLINLRNVIILKYNLYLQRKLTRLNVYNSSDYYKFGKLLKLLKHNLFYFIKAKLGTSNKTIPNYLLRNTLFKINELRILLINNMNNKNSIIF